MGGTTGTGTDAGASTSATDPNRFAGSRAALDAGTSQTPDWSTLVGLLGSASPAASAAAPAGASASPLAVNPTAAGTQYGTPPPGAAGFTSSPYPETTNLPHIGAPDKPPPAPVIPTEPVAGPMHQIWQPQGGGTAAQWLAANPNWQTDFNRAEQRADGTWWVPDDPNSPATGPKYYQGTGNVTYGGSVGMR
jgi:hypothetical protein